MHWALQTRQFERMLEWSVSQGIPSITQSSSNHHYAILHHLSCVLQEGAMREVRAHTHWVPPYWHGKAHSAEVRSEFSGLFQYQVLLFFEEALSVVLLPWLCLLLSRSSHDIVSFLHKVRPTAAAAASGARLCEVSSLNTAFCFTPE